MLKRGLPMVCPGMGLAARLQRLCRRNRFSTDGRFAGKDMRGSSRSVIYWLGSRSARSRQPEPDPVTFPIAAAAGVYAGRVTDDRHSACGVESPLVSPSQPRTAAGPDDLGVTAERCAAQLLCGDPARSAEEVTGRLLAIQAQDPRGARLAVRARSAGLSASDVNSALTQRRSLIVSWLNRGTLHLVCTEDYWWLHPLTTPQLHTGNSRRLAQEGVPPQDAERAVATVQAALAAEGPLTRSQLRERVAAAGVRTEGQAMVHILALASIRGLIVRGPLAGRDQAFVLVQDWLGTTPPAMSREAALGELARRYLAGHAPAADRDLAQWAGIRLRDARLGLARCGAIQRADGLAELPANPRRAAAALPPPLLLGAFEPLLLGWASRDPIVGRHRRIVTVNGLFRPFVLAGGRAVATWTIAGGQVALAPFAPLDAQTQAALAADAADVMRFLGE
jgi:Winged helix DNA-binding domain